MASTITRKRLGVRHPAAHAPKPRRVADMTIDELRGMMDSLVDRVLSERLSDQRVTQRRSKIAANAAATRAEYRTGEVHRGTSQDLMSELE